MGIKTTVATIGMKNAVFQHWNASSATVNHRIVRVGMDVWRSSSPTPPNPQTSKELLYITSDEVLKFQPRVI